MSIFPGKSVFSPPKPKDPEPLPDPVSIEDPAIGEAKKKSRLDAKRRSGRKSSILTGNRGASENLGSIKQASAGGASILG